jgi:hypothetical protein
VKSMKIITQRITDAAALYADAKNAAGYVPVAISLSHEDPKGELMELATLAAVRAGKAVAL